LGLPADEAIGEEKNSQEKKRQRLESGCEPSREFDWAKKGLGGKDYKFSTPES